MGITGKIGMWKSGACLLVTALHCASGATAWANSQTYAVHVPQTSRSCDSEAQALGRRFSAATGATVTGAVCADSVQIQADGITYGLYALAVTYDGDQPLTPVSSIFGHDGGNLFSLPAGYIGSYAHYQDCLSALDARSAEYQIYTGLTPVAAYCYPGGSLVTPGYALQIDGFGKPAQTLFTYDPNFSGRGNAQLSADIGKFVSSLGAHVVSQEGTRVFYYAPAALSFQSQLLANFQNADECSLQLADVAAIYAKLDQVQALPRCLTFGPDAKSWASLEVLWAEPYFMQVQEVTPAQPAGYYSLEECRKDRARVLAGYSQGTDGFWNVLGAICAPTNGIGTYPYLMKVLEQQ